MKDVYRFQTSDRSRCGISAVRFQYAVFFGPKPESLYFLLSNFD